MEQDDQPSGNQIQLTARLRSILEGLAGSRREAQQTVERARIVLMSADGLHNVDQAKSLGLGVDRQRVRRGRQRWLSFSGRIDSAQHATTAAAACEAKLKGLVLEMQKVEEATSMADAERFWLANAARLDAERAAEGAACEARKTEREFEAIVLQALRDKPRSGAPATFTAEQIVGIIAIACEKAKEAGVPVSHWTPTDIAIEAVKRGVVKSISIRQVDRYLKEVALRPHKMRYWLTSPDKLKDPAQFQRDVEKICAVYADAPRLESMGTHVASLDEKTGMQALERKHPTKPADSGREERQEFEYIRHGTLALLASFMIATGQVFPTVSETRTNTDFALHVEATIDTAKEDGWIFVVDRLNTHISEELVRLVAKRCDINVDLGVKGKRGPLKNLKTRRAFLEDDSHRIRFVYTPRHASWLNQVEIWFSVFARRVLKRGNFVSLDDLASQILDFIEYFNSVLAHPYRWTYSGRPLLAA